MRNPDQWKPTKVALAGPAHRPVLRVPAEPGALGAGSTLIATLVARWYQAALATHARGLLLDLGCGAMPYRALYAAQVSDVIGTDWPQSLHQQPHADLFAGALARHRHVAQRGDHSLGHRPGRPRR